MSRHLALTASERSTQVPGSRILVNPEAVLVVEQFTYDNGRGMCTRVVVGGPSFTHTVFVTETPEQIIRMLTAEPEGTPPA